MIICHLSEKCFKVLSQQDLLASADSVGSSVTTGGQKVRGAPAGQATGGHWGTSKGTDEDKDTLDDLIKDELKDPDNPGIPVSLKSYFTLSNDVFITALDEDLAEKVSKEFYNFYKGWKQNNRDSTPSQKVFIKK